MRNLLLFLHIAGTIFWMGGMAFMVMALRPALHAQLEPPVRLPLVVEVLRRFFVVVIASIALLLRHRRAAAAAGARRAGAGRLACDGRAGRGDDAGVRPHLLRALAAAEGGGGGSRTGPKAASA